ncbi:MAG TPA: methionyl-tRNA formyltransferase, partial [Agrobacterium sp.]|nr:methionyl-tRNA formyltransferase [Agrobacterium sp.]
FPGAWLEMEIGGKPERVKVLASELASGMGEAGSALDDVLTIACGSGAVRLTRLQKAGGKPMSAADFVRGTPVPATTRLG